METALAAKFAKTVEEALGEAPEPSAAIQELLTKEQHVATIPNDEEELRKLIARSALRQP